MVCFELVATVIPFFRSRRIDKSIHCLTIYLCLTSRVTQIMNVGVIGNPRKSLAKGYVGSQIRWSLSRREVLWLSISCTRYIKSRGWVAHTSELWPIPLPQAARKVNVVESTLYTTYTRPPLSITSANSSSSTGSPIIFIAATFLVTLLHEQIACYYLVKREKLKIGKLVDTESMLENLLLVILAPRPHGLTALHT